MEEQVEKQTLKTLEVEYIPAFLRKSAVYRSCTEIEISVPSGCWENDDAVSNAHDFSQMLRVISHWGLDEIPDSVLDYCRTNDQSIWNSEIAGCSTILAALAAHFTNSNVLLSAVQTGRGEIVRFWIKHHPQAVEKTNYETTLTHKEQDLIDFRTERYQWNERACREAVRLGHTQCLHVLHQNGCPIGDMPSLCETAVQSGYASVLQYLLTIGCPRNFTKLCDIAVRRGDVKCLECLHECGRPWSSLLCNTAVKGGHIDCLKYLHDTGAWWDPTSMCTSAATSGHLECLQYACENGCSMSEQLTLAATNMDCLRYALENGCPIHGRACYEVFFCDTPLERLQLLRKFDAPWDASEVCSVATEHGHLELLAHAHENGGVLKERLTLTKHFNCLKYALMHGCPVHKDAYTTALAGTVSFDCLQLLLDWNAPWDENTAVAALSVSEECARSLIDKGCPCGINLAVAAAAKNKYQFLHYLLEELMLPFDESVLFGAFSNGSVESVQYLVGIGCPCYIAAYTEDKSDGFRIRGVNVSYTSKLDKRVRLCIEYMFGHGWPCTRELAAYVCEAELHSSQDYIQDEGWVSSWGTPKDRNANTFVWAEDIAQTLQPHSNFRRCVVS